MSTPKFWGVKNIVTQLSAFQRAKLALTVFRNNKSEIVLPENMYRQRTLITEEKSSPYKTVLGYSLIPQRSMTNLETYYQEGYNENALIYAAVMYKSRAITQAKLTAYKLIDDEGNREPFTRKEDLYKLLKRPNYYQSADELHSLQSTFLNLTGNAFTFLFRERGTQAITEMWPLNPAWVAIIPNKNGEIAGYEYSPTYLGTEKIPIPKENMAHAKFPNPQDPLNGLGFGSSPISAAAYAGDVDNMITKFLNVFFKHGAMPVGLLKFKDMALEQEEMAVIRERWKEIYGGYENWGDIGVLDEHGEYQRIGLTFEEMEFSSLDKRNETRLLSVLGVPLSLLPNVAGLEGSTYNNKKEDREIFWQDTMSYELELFEQEYNRFFETDEQCLKWDMSEVYAYQKDVKPQVESAQILYNMGVPPRIAYKVTGLNVPDYEGIDKIFEPPIPAFGSDESNTKPNNSDNTDDETLESDDSKKSEDFLELQTFQFTSEQKKELWTKVDSIAVRWESKFSQGAIDSFESDRGGILALVGVEKKSALDNKASINWTKIATSVEGYLLRVSPLTWRNNFAPLISGIVIDNGKFWQAELGLKFDARNLEGETWFQDYVLKFAQDDILETTRGGIAEIIAQGLEDGWSIDTLSNNINTTFDKWIYDKGKAEDFDWINERLNFYRTELIARTETTRASNAGSFNLFKNWGIESKEWLSTNDDRTRDSHIAMNGQVVKIDKDFESGLGNKLSYPGDSKAPLADTANCRCTILPFGDIPK